MPLPRIDPDSGILSFEGVPDPSALARACRTAFATGVARVEARVPAGPGATETRRALHRAGFRREGIRRGEDIAVYSLLVTDTVESSLAFTAVMNTVTPRKRLIAHALLTDAAGRVLLCETSFKEDWELPGGIVEPGESPRVGCDREIVEELGIDVQLDRVLVVDWLHPHLGWDDAVELVFGCAPLTAGQVAAIRPDGAEILAAHWLSLDAACERLAPYAVGRLRAAHAALTTGTTLYLEDGVPV